MFAFTLMPANIISTAINIFYNETYTLQRIIHNVYSATYEVYILLNIRFAHYIATALYCDCIYCDCTILRLHYIATALYCDCTILRLHYIATALYCNNYFSRHYIML